jgi:hypothetical protein
MALWGFGGRSSSPTLWGFGGRSSSPTASVKRSKCNEYRRPVSIRCPRSYEPRALPLRHSGIVSGVAAFYVQLDGLWGFGGRSSSPSHCADMALWGVWGTLVVPHNEYRRPVSIRCPRGYEPRALPLRHSGNVFFCLPPPPGTEPGVRKCRILATAGCTSRVFRAFR